MSKRYREPIDQVVVGDAAPRAFRWRGCRYEVMQVLGHWREDAGWWRRPDGEELRIDQADLWRVEARNGRPSAPAGVYELVHRAGEWRLDRIWD